MNNVVVHYHIFKNAGTTVDWILKKNFGELARTFDGSDPEGTVPAHYLLDFIKQFPDSKSISSHQLRLSPSLKNDNYNFIPMIFIRDPIDRAFSIYSYFRRRDDDYSFSVKARTSSMKEFLEWYFNTNNPVMRNFQVVYLTKDDFFISVDASDYNFAKERLKNIPILGVVEQMDESLVIAEQLLSTYFEKIDLSYIKQNVSPDRNGTLESRLSVGKTLVGDEIWNLLIKSNDLDLKLYNEARETVNFRKQNIDNFEAKLKNFVERCKKLQMKYS